MHLRLGRSQVVLVPSIHLTYAPFVFSSEEARMIADADLLLLEAQAEMPPAQWRLHVPPRSVADELPAEWIAPLESLWRRCGLPAQEFSGTRLWWVSMLIGVYAHALHGARFEWGAEAQARLLRGDRPIGYLESAIDGFSAFAQAPHHELMTGIRELLFHLDERLAQAVAAFTLAARGDLGGCERLHAQYLQAAPMTWGAALGGRNRRWLPQLLAHMQSGRSVVCLVGALHAVGDDGLPALLRSAGVEVMPVSP